MDINKIEDSIREAAMSDKAINESIKTFESKCKKYSAEFLSDIGKFRKELEESLEELLEDSAKTWVCQIESIGDHYGHFKSNENKILKIFGDENKGKFIPGELIFDKNKFEYDTSDKSFKLLLLPIIENVTGKYEPPYADMFVNGLSNSICQPVGYGVLNTKWGEFDKSTIEEMLQSKEKYEKVLLEFGLFKK